MTILYGKTLRAVAATAAILAMTAAPGVTREAGPVGDIPAGLMEQLQDSYIFVFDDSISSAASAGRAATLTARHGGALGHVYTTAIRGFSAKMPADAAARLAANNPEIAYYEADGVVRAIDQAGRAAGPGVSAAASPQVTPSGILRVGGPVDGAGLTGWVIDTGIDLDHPDLNVDVARSVTFARGPKNADDANGHGTHVAGTIAAIDNDIDVVGVAAGATVVAVKVLSRSGNGTISGVIAGIDYVAANATPGDVANMSLGGGASSSLDAAVVGAAELGILFAVAAGNEGADAGTRSPARVEHANVYTVSAVDSSDVFASFSNWGNPPVDFAAPGVNVLSTLIGGGTLTLSGTSMASPHMAGVLMVTGGAPSSDGCAIGDPDGNPDPIVNIVAGALC